MALRVFRIDWACANPVGSEQPVDAAEARCEMVSEAVEERSRCAIRRLCNAWALLLYCLTGTFERRRGVE
jgi:hypothetical protein